MKGCFHLQLPLIVWLLQGIPECLVSTALAMVIAMGCLQWKKIVLIGLIQACLVYLVRLLPITFGVHTILMIISLAVLLAAIAKVKLITSLTVSIVTFTVIFVCEAFSRWFIVRVGLISPEDMAGSVFWRVVMGLPQIIVLSAMTFLFNLKMKAKKLEMKENM